MRKHGVFFFLLQKFFLFSSLRTAVFVVQCKVHNKGVLTLYCMKCGKRTGKTQVFCDECLAVMEKYPVKPDVAIQLPKRKPLDPDKKPAPLAAAQETSPHKGLIRLLIFTIFVLVAIVCALGWQLFVSHGGSLDALF